MYLIVDIGKKTIFSVLMPLI